MSKFYLWWLLNVSEPLFERYYHRRWYRFVTRVWNNCVHEPWYRLKCRLWHRFNVIYISTLTPTWHDRDEVLLHAAFQILVDFVDREKPFDRFNVPESPSKAHWGEILRLYAWWTVERPARKNPFDQPGLKWTRAQLKVAERIEQQDGDEDQEMLVRLVLVRKMLWT